MKKTNQRTIRWSSILFLLLAAATLAFGLSTNKTPSADQETPPKAPLHQAQSGTLSNEEFSQLIEQSLKELNFVENVTFSGKDDGYFNISGTFTNPERLLTLNSELRSFEFLLTALKNESVTIQGHLGKNELGNGCFVTDTVTFSDYTVPAGIGTEYLERYTTLNQLLAVPFEEIRFSKTGVSYENGLPEFIQTALYK